MSVPDWWAFLLLALAAYRTWRLLSEDTILQRPRYRLVMLPPDWEEQDGLPDDYRHRLAEFITCPWCLGFWVVLGWWGAWQAWPHATEVAAVPLALSAVVGTFATLDRGE